MKSRRVLRPLAGAAALALLTTAAQAADNILVNGSFEAGLGSWTTSGFVLQGYDWGLDGLSHAGSQAFYGGGIGAPGWLQQTLLTEIGETYVVQFWLQSDGYLPNLVQVQADGVLRYEATDLMVTEYTLVSTTFTATQNLTPLRFGLRNDSGFFHLDSITVTPVPEPAAYALWGVGLAGLLLRRRAFGVA